MKHLNKKIGMIGQKIVCNYLRYNKINYWTNFNDNYNKTDIIMEKDNVISFVEVSTKQFTTKNGLKVTGKNTKQINSYIQRQKQFNIKYFIVFVDIKNNSIYGNYLDNLLNNTTYKNSVFPLEINCGGQHITFFSLYDMIKLKELSKEEKEQLSILTFKNKNNKFQTDIYDTIRSTRTF
tara:strand:- start:149 stop:685 length:537 start_codon:yes stop_codon:yes gene_type:complete